MKVRTKLFRKSRRHKKRKLFFPILIVFIAIIFFWKSKEVINKSKAFDLIIQETAKRHNVDSSLIKAIIDQESSFNPRAVGGVGEIGLMQLQMIVVEEWAKSQKINTPYRGSVFQPELNIEIGSWYYAKALNRNKEYRYAEEMALCEYNAGRGATRKWAGWPPKNKNQNIIDLIKFPQTKKYVKSIMKKYAKYAKEYKDEKNK